VVHERALAEGVAVIHNITSPAIGMMVRMTGSRELTISLDQRVFLISPPPHRSYRAFGARLLSAVQRGLLAAVRGCLRLLGAPRVEVNAAEHLDRQLPALAALDPAAGDRWGIS